MKSPSITSACLSLSAVLLLSGASSGTVEAHHPPEVRAGVLYETNFDDLALGTIDGQDNWIVEQKTAEPFDWAVVVDDGTGNQVLEIRSGFASNNWGGFGGGVHRSYTPSSERFVTIEMYFLLPERGRFYFMDNRPEGGGPSSIFWGGGGEVWPSQSSVSVRASENTWHRVAFTVDQTIRTIIEFSFDGEAQPVSDADYLPPSMLSELIFNGYGPSFDQPGRLWIDDLTITSAPAPELLNDLVSFYPDPSTYYTTRNTSGCPSGFIGKFGFVAQLINTSQSTLAELQVEIAELSSGNLVLTEVGTTIEAGTTIGEGFALPVPNEGHYTDGYFAPSEYVDVQFRICLQSRRRFRFFVNVQGSEVELPTESGLIAPDGLAARFGRTVEIQDHFAFVGDDQQPGGAVYVYEFDGTRWVPTDKLVGDVDSRMGNSLFVDGDLLVAGDPAGRSAYVFRYDGSRYRREARLRPNDPNANLIATSVGVSGNTIVVSGLQRWPGGATYVYDHDGLEWSLSTTLTVPGASWVFGHCAIQGDTIVIGDTGNDSASVFERTVGAWTETQRLLPSDAGKQLAQNFGLPVRIDGDRIAVGAVWDTERRGAVYVYHRNASGWEEVAKLISEGAARGDYIGFGLSLEGNRIITGATRENVDAERSGAAYLFEFDGSRWLQTLRLIRQTPTVECQGDCVYGVFVALSGSRAIVGESGADRAWIYEDLSTAPLFDN